MASPVFELRVALTTDLYTQVVAFYRDGLGLKIGIIWSDEGTRSLIFEDMPRATLEVFDQAAAEAVDQLEVGHRVSGQIRFAFQVPDVDAALERALAHGGTLVHDPVVTPWQHRNARVQAPDGMQITLFQDLEATSQEAAHD